jgi:hypothetical protein
MSTPARRSVAAKTAAPVTGWRNSQACVATYNVLEHDDKMDQFEDTDVPFDAAGRLSMKQLRYWPGIDLPDGALSMIALGKAREFLVLVQKNFTARKEDPNMKSGEVIRSVGKLFEREDATLEQIAVVLDSFIRFPDE